MKIIIGDEHGGFFIDIDGKRFYFSDEEDHKGLVEVFKYLGFEHVSWEEVC